MRRIAILTIFLMSGIWSVHAGLIKSIRTYNGYETGGINVELATTATLCTGRVWVDGREAHSLVAYDQNHMATSLFGLAANSRVVVRAEVSDGAGISGTTETVLVTKPDWSLTEPTRTVTVDTSATLRAALAAVLPGDHIILEPGIYEGPFIVQRRSTLPLNTGKRITIMGLNDEVRSVLRAPGGGPAVAIEIYGVPDVTLYNLDVQGKVNYRSTTGAQVVGCRIANTYQGGDGYIGYALWIGAHYYLSAPLDPLVSNHLIQDCEITGGGPTSGPYYGVYIGDRPGRGVTIRRNRISGFRGDGIAGAGGTNDEGRRPRVTLKTPDVLGIGPLKYPGSEVDIHDNTITDCADDAIEFDGWCVNGRIFHNRLAPNGAHVITTAKVWPGPVFIVRNTMTDFYGSGLKLNNGLPGQTRNIFYYHNTVVKNDTLDAYGHTHHLLYLSQGDAYNVVFRNNVFLSARHLLFGGAPAIDLDLDYNLYHSRGLGSLGQAPFAAFLSAGGLVGNEKIYGKDLALLVERITAMYATKDPTPQTKPHDNPPAREILWETHGLQADPMLGPTLRPMPGSPAIDRGVVIPGINNDCAGGAPDLGAWEVPQITPTPLPPPVEFEHAGGRWRTTGPAEWVKP